MIYTTLRSALCALLLVTTLGFAQEGPGLPLPGKHPATSSTAAPADQYLHALREDLRQVIDEFDDEGLAEFAQAPGWSVAANVDALLERLEVLGMQRTFDAVIDALGTVRARFKDLDFSSIAAREQDVVGSALRHGSRLAYLRELERDVESVVGDDEQAELARSDAWQKVPNVDGLLDSLRALDMQLTFDAVIDALGTVRARFQDLDFAKVSKQELGTVLRALQAQREKAYLAALAADAEDVLRDVAPVDLETQELADVDALLAALEQGGHSEAYDAVLDALGTVRARYPHLDFAKVSQQELSLLRRALAGKPGAAQGLKDKLD